MDETLELMFLKICMILGLHPDNVRRKCRKTELKMARYFYFYFARKMTDKTLLEISTVCTKDHATILHGIKLIKDLHCLNRYEQFNSDYSIIEIELIELLDSKFICFIDEHIYLYEKKLIELKIKKNGNNKTTSDREKADRPY